MVYRRKDRDSWFVAVPTRNGGRVKRSTGTAHRPTALKIAAMVETLGPKRDRAWDLLDRIEDNTLSLGDLYDAFVMNALGDLRDRLRAKDADAETAALAAAALAADPDIEPEVATWARWLPDEVKPDTVTLYVSYVRTLIPAGVPFRRSALTAPAIARWIDTAESLPQKRRKTTTGESKRKDDPAPRPVSADTRRKRLSAVGSFARYCVRIGVLDSNPARIVEPPPPGKPRLVELDLRDVRRVVDAARPPYRALFALLYGSGIEITVACQLVEGDVDMARREVRARGTKEATRDRIARVADWAWPEFEKHLGTLMPGERVFRGLDRWKASDAHRETLRILGLPHHRVHDARHFYAIRAVRAGTPVEIVARQLGHADAVMVLKTYGKFAPRSDERDRWEKIAAALDTPATVTESGPLGTVAGTSRPATERPGTNKAANPLKDSGFVSGAWGARTPDPRLAKADLGPDPEPEPPPTY